MSAPVFQLSSGEMSSEYLDCRTALSASRALIDVGDTICGRLDARVAAIGGMTLGADPLAIGTSIRSWYTGHSVNWFSVRKTPKGHGTRKLIEGNVTVGNVVTVVDDVVTTGESTIQAVFACRDAGLKVVQVIALVDREQGAVSAIAEATGVTPLVIFTLSEIAARYRELKP